MLSQAAELVSNQILRLDPEMYGKLRPFVGKCLAINIDGFNGTFYLLIGQNQLHIEREFEGQPDAVVSGQVSAFLKILTGDEQQSLFANGSLEIEGDTRVAQELARVMCDMDIDWEEYLARVVGDFPARKLGNVTRSLQAWGERTRTTVAGNLGEYLTEERKDLAPPSELEHFYRDVDELRSDVERLDQRIQRIRIKLDERT